MNLETFQRLGCIFGLIIIILVICIIAVQLDKANTNDRIIALVGKGVEPSVANCIVNLAGNCRCINLSK